LGAHKDFITRSGILFNIQSFGRVDTYHSVLDDDKTKISKSFPILENKVSCSYPMYSKFSSDEYTSIWGPKISFSSIRTGNKRQNFSINEDSVFNDFNDLNLFEINRYGGIDMLERNERVSFGLEDSIYTSHRKILNFFVGKSKSDNVGRIVIHPTDFCAVRSRFVGFPFNHNLKMFELGSTFKINKFSLDVSYFGDKRKNKHRNFSLSQIGGSVGYQINQYWSISYSEILNLQKKAGNRNLSRGIFTKYQDECCEFGFGIYKSKYKDIDIKPRTGIVLTFAFKNLGEVSQSSKRFKYKSIVGNVE
jgi:lipopolysaccharide assembly outer membrane protein LptD (OstA)